MSGNDEPKPAQDGTYGKKQEFDARGLITRVTFLDQEKRPVRSNVDGIVTGELAYDAESNLVHKAFFNALNQPVLNSSSYHKLIEKCDESGNAIETTFWGVNQEPILDATGVHKFTQKY